MKFYLILLIFVLTMLTVFFTGIDMVWYFVASVIWVAVVVTGVSVMRYNLFLEAQSKIKNSKVEVALTFDDGPDEVQTPKVLDLLKLYNAKATFFCIGKKIEGNETIILRMINEGHSVGNHTYEHANTFPIWSVRRMKQSIQKTDLLIFNINGVHNIFFRPPFGVTNCLIASALKSLNKETIGWSIRTKTHARVMIRLLAKLKKI